MAGQVQVERVGPVGLVALGRPILDRGLRGAVMGALDALEADPEILSIVLLCPETTPDAVDPATDTVPTLADLCESVEGCNKPVVAGLAGLASGAMAELAMAAHYRLATEGACLCFPGVVTGTLAGGGATQRLPRLGGAGVALRLLLDSVPMTATQAQDAGLVDGIVQGDLVETSVTLARQLAEQNVPPRPARDCARGLADRTAYHAAIDEARERGQRFPDEAQARIIECIEAALLLTYESGLGFEQSAAASLARSEQAIALRHLAVAQRRAFAAPPQEVDGDAPVRSAVVVAGGRQGAALCLSLLRAGIEVTVSDPDSEAAARTLSMVGDGLATEMVEGRLDDAGRRAHLARLQSDDGSRDLAPCDLRVRFARVDGTFPAERGGPAGLDALVVAAQDPLRLEGNLNRAVLLVPTQENPGQGLSELIGCDGTPPEALQALARTLRRIGAHPVVAPRQGRSLVGALSERFRDAADHMLEDGAVPRQVDAALEAAGFRSGPYRWLDRVGLDGAWHRRQEAARHRDPRDRFVTVLERVYATGRRGQQAGRGFYDYPQGIPEGVPAAAVDRLVADARSQAGMAARDVPDAEIMERCRLALVVAGFHMIEQGVARNSGEVDVVCVSGLGFPRALGGPMHLAGRAGLEHTRDRLVELSCREDSRFWAPPSLLEDLVARRQGLAALSSVA